MWEYSVVRASIYLTGNNNQRILWEKIRRTNKHGLDANNRWTMRVSTPVATAIASIWQARHNVNPEIKAVAKFSVINFYL